MKGIRLLTSVIALTMCLDVWPQTDTLALERTIGNWFLNYSQPDYRPTLQPGLSRCKVDSVKKTLHLYGAPVRERGIRLTDVHTPNGGRNI